MLHLLNRSVTLSIGNYIIVDDLTRKCLIQMMHSETEIQPTLSICPILHF